jgi:hypothetical protein
VCHDDALRSHSFFVLASNRGHRRLSVGYAAFFVNNGPIMPLRRSDMTASDCTGSGHVHAGIGC